MARTSGPQSRSNEAGADRPSFTSLRESWNYKPPPPNQPNDRVFTFADVPVDPRFARLTLGDEFAPVQAAFASASTSSAAADALRRRWQPPRLIGRCASWNDCPVVGPAPAFSRRAVDALYELTTPNGTLLPFKSRGRSYWFFVASTAEAALNTRKSGIKRQHLINGRRTSVIHYYHFNVNRLRERPIFRIKQQPFRTFVTDAFVRRVNESGLLGFHCEVLFPLREKDVGGNLWLRAERRHLAEGYRPGECLNGTRVCVRFKLDNPDRVPTARQERQIRTWANGVDALLFDIDSVAPPMGHLGDVDMNTGDATCVFFGPRAETILSRVRQQLPQAGWGGKVVVTSSRR